MKSSSPRGPAAKVTPTTNPRTMTGIVSATTKLKSATVSPSSRANRLTGVTDSRSK